MKLSSSVLALFGFGKTLRFHILIRACSGGMVESISPPPPLPYPPCPDFVFWTPVTHEQLFLKFHHLSKQWCFLVIFTVNFLSCFICFILIFSPLCFSPSILHFSQTNKKTTTLKSATNASWSQSRHPNFINLIFVFINLIFVLRSFDMCFLYETKGGLFVLYDLLWTVNVPSPEVCIFDTKWE